MKNTQKQTYNENIPYWAKSFDPKATFIIPSWFSKKKSYIQLYRQSNKVNVRDKANFEIKIKSLKDMASQKLFFQLQSRSNVQLAGYFEFQSNNTILSSNQHSLEATIEFVDSFTERFEHNTSKQGTI